MSHLTHQDFVDPFAFLLEYYVYHGKFNEKKTVHEKFYLK